MSHYYGGVQGNRGEATRGGSRASGYTSWAQDDTHQVRTHLWTCEDSGRTMARVTVQSSSINHHGLNTKVLFEGALEDCAYKHDFKWKFTSAELRA